MSEYFLDKFGERISGPWTDIRFHLPLLFNRACAVEKVQVMECGVRGANSTLAFLAAAEKTGGHVWSYDIEEPDLPEGEKEKWEETGLWTFTKSDSAWIPEDKLPTEPIDILFLDTDHNIYQQLLELQRHVPLVKPGGIVFIHDVAWASPEMKGHVPGTFGPVAWALDEYCRDDDREPDRWWYAFPGSYGMGVLNV